MTRFRVALSAEEFRDAKVEAERRQITAEECIAGRLHGKAAEKSKKRVGPAHLTITAKNAYAEYDELPDAEFQFDMTAGPLRNAATSVGADTPVKLRIDGDEVPVAGSYIVVDDGVFYIDVTMPSPSEPAQPIDTVALRGALLAQTFDAVDAMESVAIPAGAEAGGEA